MKWTGGASVVRRCRGGLVVLALTGFTAAAQAPLDVRIALVIGNAAYAGAAALPNPVNDAAAMSASLQKLGFEVTQVRDGSREQMARAIIAVREQLQGKGGVGLFYYAGHGMQVDWRNYMVPVDAQPKSASDVAMLTIGVDNVLTAFKAAGNRMNIVVLDACRDNPFQASASGKGLAQVDAPSGTFLAYATAPGHVAEDGAAGGNGLYTGFLLQELQRPTARIEDVFKRVRFHVRQRSQGRQIPWESTSLEDDFVFNDGRAAGMASRTPPPVIPRDRVFEAEKAEWDRIKGSRNADDFYAFLQKFPNGLISEAAQDRLDTLAKPPLVASPAAGRAPIHRDFRVGDEMEYLYRDARTQTETRREVWRVTAVRDGQVAINDGANVMTNSGATIRNDMGIEFDPPLQTLPVGDFQLGRKWVARSNQSAPNHPDPATRARVRGWVEQEGQVTAYESVTVPAGTFQVYRIESKLSSESGLAGTVTNWVTADGVVVKYVRRARQRDGRESSWDREAVRVKLAARS